MARIDVTAPIKTPLRTSLIFGPSGAGKTTFCATYPQVAWIGSKREGGWESITYADRDQWYDPKVAPVVFAVDEIGDMMGHLYKDIKPGVERGVFRTVCIELTFHADDAMRAMPIDEKNGWAKYANLENHVHNLDMLVKSMQGLRVVYNTLAHPEDSTKGTGGVMIPGKALAKKIPALCDLTGYLHAEDCDDHVDRVLELTAYGNYSARHRYGKKLPDRVRNPTYRKLEDLLSGKAKADSDGNVSYEEPKLVSLPNAKPLAPLGSKTK